MVGRRVGAARAGGGAPFAIGIDLGGSKTEAIALDGAGTERWRRRIATPSAQGYEAILEALAGLVAQARQAVGGAPATLGIGGPGSLTAGGLVKNANTSRFPRPKPRPPLWGHPVWQGGVRPPAGCRPGSTRHRPGSPG